MVRQVYTKAVWFAFVSSMDNLPKHVQDVVLKSTQTQQTRFQSVKAGSQLQELPSKFCFSAKVGVFDRV